MNSWMNGIKGKELLVTKYQPKGNLTSAELKANLNDISMNNDDIHCVSWWVCSNEESLMNGENQDWWR